MNARKLVIATSIYPPVVAGPAAHFASLKSEFEKRGWEVRVLIRPGIFTLLRHAGAGTSVLAHATPSVLLPVFFARCFKKFPLIIRIGGDFFWERTVESGTFFGTLKDFYAGSGVWSMRYRLLARLLGLAYRRADALVFTSALLRDIYIPFFRLDERKAHTVMHPVPESRIKKQPFSAEGGSAPGGDAAQGRELRSKDIERVTRIIYAGRFIKLKNLELLLEVFAEARKAHPNISLTLIGEGPERQSLEARSKNLELRDVVNIRKPLQRNAVLEEIAKSDLVVLPSLSEVSPNLFFDALATGTPVLATQENGYRELFQSVFTFFDPMDKADFLAKFKALLELGALERMRERLRAFRYERTWHDIANEYETLFRACTKRE